jgi:glycosyltransferase involved in cell wall biosynthesis
MRIGFDAKWLFSGNPSGRIVVRNLLENLSLNGKDHEIFVFLKKSERGIKFPYDAPNFHPVYVWGKNNFLSNFFVIPVKAYSLKLDICVFQYFSPLFANFKKINFIYDVIFKSNPEYFSLIERIYFSPMKILARLSHGVCTGSESEKKRLLKYGFSTGEKITIIYNGVTNDFKPKENQDKSLLNEVSGKYNLPEKFLLYVGRLNERKNLSNLVKSITFLKNPSIKLVLAGAYDWKKSNLRTLTTNLGLEKRVIFTGFVEDKYLAPLYSLAKIFCYVSFDEGFGLPPLEAMASGVPVVVADTGSLPEICSDAGHYADPSKPEEIAQQIDLLLKDKQLYLEKRKLGLERAKFFTWEKAAKKILIVCENTLK